MSIPWTFVFICAGVMSFIIPAAIMPHMGISASGRKPGPVTYFLLACMVFAALTGIVGLMFAFGDFLITNNGPSFMDGT